MAVIESFSSTDKCHQCHYAQVVQYEGSENRGMALGREAMQIIRVAIAHHLAFHIIQQSSINNVNTVFSDLTFSVILHAPSSFIIVCDKNFCSYG